MKYLPLFLDLRDRRVLVVGPGPETEYKVAQLVEAGARVTFVAAQPVSAVEKLVAQGQLRRYIREFREADLDDVWLVVCTATDRNLSERIVSAAERRRIFFNVVDVTDMCAFIYPAIVARDDVQIAISTAGKSPALAQRLKRLLAAVVGPEYGVLNDLLGSIRRRVIGLLPDREQRAELFHRMAGRQHLQQVRNGDTGAVEQRLAQLLEQAAAEAGKRADSKTNGQFLQKNLC